MRVLLIVILLKEVDFVQKMIRMAPNNESAWNYLYGLLVPVPCILSNRTENLTIRDLPGFSTSVTTVNENDEHLPSSDSFTTGPIDPEIPSIHIQRMRHFAEDLANSDAVASNSPALLGFLVEVYTDSLKARIRQEKMDKKRSVGNRWSSQFPICCDA